MNKGVSPLTIAVVGRGSQGKVWSKLLDCPCLPGRDIEGVLEQWACDQRPLPRYWILAVPDPAIPEVTRTIREACSRWHPDPVFILLTGFAVTKGLIEAKNKEQVWMLAPKAIAPMLWERVQQGQGFYCVIDTQIGPQCQVGRSESLKEAKHFACTVGAKPHQIIEASFADETHADLFSEQTILCRWIPEGLERSYLFLVKQRIPPQLAWIECVFEAKLIMDVIVQQGMAQFWNRISPVAAIGAATNTTPSWTPRDLQAVWDRLFSGEFDQILAQELDHNMPRTREFQAAMAASDSGRITE